jgi:hypothetical protein
VTARAGSGKTHVSEGYGLPRRIEHQAVCECLANEFGFSRSWMPSAHLPGRAVGNSTFSAAYLFGPLMIEYVGPHRLLKNSCFVSGHDFSRAVKNGD